MKNRRSKRNLLPAEMIQMALKRYNVSPTDKNFTPLEQLADEFDRDEAVLSRAIFRAFRDGLVQVRPADAVPYERVKSLETRIESRFPKTRAIVVSIPESHAPHKAEDVKKRDVKLNQRLGSVAAEVLANSNLFRDGDVVGVGAGAAVFYLVDTLRRITKEARPLPVDDLSLLALVGSLKPADHFGVIRMKLDADFNVNILADCFSRGDPRTLNVSLSYLDGSRLEKALDAWNVAEGSRLSSLTHVMVGLGVLNDGHRMRELAAVPKTDPLFGGIQGNLSQLLALADKHSDPGSDYFPLAEVCCRLFLVDEKRIPKRDADEIKGLIARLDKSLLTVPLAMLQKVPATLLVAGGRHKALAIREFLSWEGWRVRHLFTDGDTANRILGSSV